MACPMVAVASVRSGWAADVSRSLRSDSRIIQCAPTPAGFATVRPLAPTAAIIDGVARSIPELLAAIGASQREIPGVPLVLYTGLGSAAAPLLEQANDDGTTIVIVDPAAEPVVRYRAVARAHAALVSRDFEGAAGPSLLERVARCVVAGACSDLTAPQLAAAVGVPYWRLRRHLARRGLPSPRALIQWGRVVYAS